MAKEKPLIHPYIPKACPSHKGGGCWQHDVPAVCDDIVSRSEVLTAYAGEEYGDLGKFQTFLL